MLVAIGPTFSSLQSDSRPNTGISNAKDRTAALDGEVRRETTQLNDWVTCVSASTPKGKAEIQSLSAKISAAKEQIARIEGEQKIDRPSLSSTTLVDEQRNAQNRADASPRMRLWQQSTRPIDHTGVLLNVVA